MNINSGDKLVVKKKTHFLNEGNVVTVLSVDNDAEVMAFTFGCDGLEYKGVMSFSKCEEHFEKIVENKKVKIPSVSEEHVEWIIANSEFETHTVFDKCTIVSCKLPNGFVIVESSACVSPENYDENLGEAICISKIEDKIWELEGYNLQQRLYNGCCDECCDECIDNDVDCDNCDDYNCPCNNNL